MQREKYDTITRFPRHNFKEILDRGRTSSRSVLKRRRLRSADEYGSPMLTPCFALRGSNSQLHLLVSWMYLYRSKPSQLLERQELLTRMPGKGSSSSHETEVLGAHRSPPCGSRNFVLRCSLSMIESPQNCDQPSTSGLQSRNPLSIKTCPETHYTCNFAFN